MGAPRLCRSCCSARDWELLQRPLLLSDSLGALAPCDEEDEHGKYSRLYIEDVDEPDKLIPGTEDRSVFQVYPRVPQLAGGKKYLDPKTPPVLPVRRREPSERFYLNDLRGITQIELSEHMHFPIVRALTCSMTAWDQLSRLSQRRRSIVERSTFDTVLSSYG